jgi:hypothetical protein
MVKAVTPYTYRATRLEQRLTQKFLSALGTDGTNQSGLPPSYVVNAGRNSGSFEIVLPGLVFLPTGLAIFSSQFSMIQVVGYVSPLGSSCSILACIQPLLLTPNKFSSLPPIFP